MLLFVAQYIQCGIIIKNQERNMKDINLYAEAVSFAKSFGLSRAVYWNSKCGKFCPRAYSATVIAQKTNDAFAGFLKKN